MNIKKLYLKDRLNQVDQDYLLYEEEMSKVEDLDRILNLVKLNVKVSNPNNSILFYLTGLSDEFDFEKERSNMIGGSPPDIDLDHDALDREKAIQWCIDNWGREKVAQIITHGRLKPKSLARSYYRVTEGPTEDLTELLKTIPPPTHGKEATLNEILELNPELETEDKYKNFLEFAKTTENLISNFGIHAAGVIISDFEINETIPLWKNSKSERITQFDKDECEELGLLKFDFLGIDTLSIIKNICKLIKENHSIEIDPYKNISDGDRETYELLNSGLLTGIFQMETSGTAKQIIRSVKPESIEDLSAISALNRPGPIQAGLDKEYIENKKNNAPPNNMSDELAAILKHSYWTLVYQEQVMDICVKLAGFTQREADDVRRAMGKKKIEVLNTYKEKFLNGCKTIDAIKETTAKSLWDDLLGFADYCLVGETKIPTKNYGLIKIKDLIEKKDESVLILTYDLISQKLKWTFFSGVHISNKEVSKYEFEDGSSITCTDDHLILSKDNEMIKIKDAFEKQISIKVI